MSARMTWAVMGLLGLLVVLDVALLVVVERAVRPPARCVVYTWVDDGTGALVRRGVWAPCEE